MNLHHNRLIILSQLLAVKSHFFESYAFCVYLLYKYSKKIFFP